MNGAVKFFRGLSAPMKGMYLIFTSVPLFFLAAIPFWICVGVAFYGFFWFMKNPLAIAPLMLQWIPGLQSFVEHLKIGEFSLFDAVVQGMTWVFLIVVVAYFSYIVLTIVGAPFYSLMTDTILERKGVRPAGTNNFFRWLYTTLKMLMISVMKLVFFIAMAALLFMFSFIPAVMLLVPICMCLLIAYDCFDFSFECMTFSVRQRWNFFYQHFPAFAGLAVVILLVGSIPGVFSFLLPFFIAGGADLFADLQLKGQT